MRGGGGMRGGGMRGGGNAKGGGPPGATAPNSQNQPSAEQRRKRRAHMARRRAVGAATLRGKIKRNDQFMLWRALRILNDDQKAKAAAVLRENGHQMPKRSDEPPVL